MRLHHPPRNWSLYTHTVNAARKGKAFFATPKPYTTPSHHPPRSTMEATSTSPPPERASSPDPWATPSLALGSIPILDRSVSTASSVSSQSGLSVGSRLSDGGKRRGYMRPEGTQFSRSARSRESVMNLGTIAHLQYYFARTGLLDTATGRVAKGMKAGTKTPSGSGYESDVPASPLLMADGSLDHLGEGMVESPLDETASVTWDESESVMLPPTVSTYKNNPVYIPPPPDMTVLRRELRESLQEAMKHVQEIEKGFDSAEPTTLVHAHTHESIDQSKWYEVQGLSLLDVTTLAIRAAKNYYTGHEAPQRLYAIKSEKRIRGALYQVLEVLKRMALRNFDNGVQPHEVTQVKQWIDDITGLLDTEEAKEAEEVAERESWTWQEGDWVGKERERELAFLRSFDSSEEPLPDWADYRQPEMPTPFLSVLQNGLRLVYLHNTLVRKSTRQFEEIKQYHTDTAKPYRCADNLRYWVKAAELRWDIKLDVDVMGIVQGKDTAAWAKFDGALLKWCTGVREELTAEWQKQKKQRRAPILQIDPNYEAA